MDNLRAVAGQLIAGRISVADACEKARDAILGTRRAFGMAGRVLRSSTEVEQDLRDLSAYVSEYSIGDREKWAGTLLMLHVQLVMEDVPAAVRLGKSVVQVSRGSCPAAAKPYAVAIMDSILERGGDLTSAERELFTQARSGYSRSA